jgi:hypothetical protein
LAKNVFPVPGAPVRMMFLLIFNICSIFSINFFILFVLITTY